MSGDYHLLKATARRSLCVIAAALVGSLLTPYAQGQVSSPPSRIRAYYIAADEVDWDYAPGGVNRMMGMKFEGYSTVFTERGAHRIGTVYRKATYREYTDDTFTRLKPRAPEWEHTGILGPILRAKVGDTIKILFKNNASRPYSMHPHGVLYNKDSEGAPYDDGTSGKDKEDDAVPPGKTHTYIWRVPERSGPGPNDPSSVVWLYHSHVNELKDVESGLIGAMIVTRQGMASADGKPKDVDREFICLFLLFDENVSWYLDHNLQTFTTDPKGVNKLEFAPVDNEGNAINGHIYGAGPLMKMKKGEHVRWYLVALGEQFSVHTPHWHGNVVTHDGKRTDVIPLMQAQMETVDMVPDNPGTWMFHCHIDDHMDAGMATLYVVEP